MKTEHPTERRFTLEELGFSHHFSSQLNLDEYEQFQSVRVVEVQRDRLNAIGESGLVELSLGSDISAGDCAVGDWVLIDSHYRVGRILEPKSALIRRSAGTHVATQYIANNVDTLFVVTSCNADFNEARLERYLALAKESDVNAVILLTKADLSDEAAVLQRKAESLMNDLIALPVNATDKTIVKQLEAWTGVGQTVALVGSSGVGKTTLMNALTGQEDATQGIREDDAKGKHTTTYRSMRLMHNGGWVIDTPGMRALRLQGSSDGISTVFEEIIETASRCRYADCQHESEPGCAVQEAISSGELDAERLKRWRKLQRENLYNTQSVAQTRKREKAFSKSVNRVIRGKHVNKRRGDTEL
jgi:ribosome biogenesis GTPase